MMVGKDQSGFPEDLPVLKSLQLFQFLFSHFKYRTLGRYSRSFSSLDVGGEIDFHLP